MQVSWQRTAVNKISPMCFHLKRGEDDRSSEASLQVKLDGFLLRPRIILFVKIFEFYLVTQSL
jgi:hypothetical protein